MYCTNCHRVRLYTSEELRSEICSYCVRQRYDSGDYDGPLPLDDDDKIKGDPVEWMNGRPKGSHW